MVTHSEALGRFNAAVGKRDLEAASRAAREMAATGPVSLHCALEIPFAKELSHIHLA